MFLCLYMHCRAEAESEARRSEARGLKSQQRRGVLGGSKPYPNNYGVWGALKAPSGGPARTEPLPPKGFLVF